MDVLQVHDTHSVRGLRRSWDQKLVEPTPDPSELPENARKRIESLTSDIDQPLFDLASKKLDQFKASVLADDEQRGRFRVIEREFGVIQRLLSAELCSNTPLLPQSKQQQQGSVSGVNAVSGKLESKSESAASSAMSKACEWYSLVDLRYERTINDSGFGFATPVAFSFR